MERIVTKQGFISTTLIFDVFVSGIDQKDYPDFCDAYISKAKIAGRELDEEELEYLTDSNPEYVNQMAHEQLQGAADHLKD